MVVSRFYLLFTILNLWKHNKIISYGLFIIKIHDFRSEKLSSIEDEKDDMLPRTQLHDELTTIGN